VQGVLLEGTICRKYHLHSNGINCWLQFWASTYSFTTIQGVCWWHQHTVLTYKCWHHTTQATREGLSVLAKRRLAHRASHSHTLTHALGMLHNANILIDNCISSPYLHAYTLQCNPVVGGPHVVHMSCRFLHAANWIAL
jgi:hypothetical protein